MNTTQSHYTSNDTNDSKPRETTSGTGWVNSEFFRFQMYSNHQVEAPSKVLVGAVACATTVLVAALTYSLTSEVLESYGPR